MSKGKCAKIVWSRNKEKPGVVGAEGQRERWYKVTEVTNQEHAGACRPAEGFRFYLNGYESWYWSSSYKLELRDHLYLLGLHRS